MPKLGNVSIAPLEIPAMKFRLLLSLVAGTAFATPVLAQPAAAKPVWVYAHDLKVRKGGDTDWDKATKIGVEVFKEPLGGATLAISQAGNLSVMEAGQAGTTKTAEWQFAHDMRARKADERLRLCQVYVAKERETSGDAARGGVKEHTDERDSGVPESLARRHRLRHLHEA